MRKGRGRDRGGKRGEIMMGGGKEGIMRGKERVRGEEGGVPKEGEGKRRSEELRKGVNSEELGLLLSLHLL